MRRQVLRLVLVMSAPVLMAVALASPSLKRDDGVISYDGWLLLVAASALIVVAAAVGTEWSRSARLFALGLVAAGCSLALIDAPNYGVFQHYRSWTELFSSPRGLFLIAPAAQIAAGIASRKTLIRLIRPLRSALSIGQLVLVAAAVLAGAAYGSRDLPKYVGELVLAVAVMAANTLNLALLAASIPEKALVALQNRWPVRTRWIPLLPAGFVIVVAAFLSAFAFERIPHITDSIGYYFQAKYFAQGRLYVDAPPNHEAFAYEKFHDDGVKWWSSGFPGWPAVLALGVVVRLPWVMNPLLGGLSVLLAHALMRRLYGLEFAHLFACLLALSPWLLVMSASYMAHPTALVCGLLSLFAIEKTREGCGTAWAGVAGVSIGWLFLTRPLEGIAMAPVAAVWAWWRRPRLAWGPSVVAGVSGALVSSLMLLYNQALTGSYWYAPHAKWSDAFWYPGADRIGFGSQIGNVNWPHLDPLPGHGLLDVLINLNQNVFSLNTELFGWGMGSLVFAALFLALRRWNTADKLLLLAGLAIPAAHVFYWHGGGPDLGARYWYLCVVPLVAFTLRGADAIHSRLFPEAGTGLQRLGAVIALAAIIALIDFMPWRALGKYYHYRRVRADLTRLAREHRFGRSLVFIREKEDRDYASAVVFNDPALRSDAPVYARDLGPESRSLVSQRFANRPVWIVEAVAPGGRFQVVSGPLVNGGRAPSEMRR